MKNPNEQILKIDNQRLAQALQNLEKVVENKINKIELEKSELEQRVKKLETINHNHQLAQNSIKEDLEKIKNIIRNK